LIITEEHFSDFSTFHVIDYIKVVHVQLENTCNFQPII